MIIFRKIIGVWFLVSLFLISRLASAESEVPTYGCDEETGDCDTPDMAQDPDDAPYQNPWDYDNDYLSDDEDLCPYIYDSFFLEDEIPDGGVQSSIPQGEFSQMDEDIDLVGDACDNCNFVQNQNQADMDADGIGDSCDDDKDGDLVLDDGSDQPDNEEDEIDGGIDAGADFGGGESRGWNDNCSWYYNPTQEDVDLDGKGDACDDDIDGDGLDNLDDDCPFGDPSELTPEECLGDSDGDGVLDFDISGDGTQPGDNCPTVVNPEQDDADLDGTGDACDQDVDHDGVPNIRDNCYLPKEEIDPNSAAMEGWENYKDTYNEDQADSDRDGIGDACDCNPNCFVVPKLVDEYIPDEQFINEGCDANGEPIEGFCSETEVCLDPDCPFMVDTPHVPYLPNGGIPVVLRLFSNRQNAVIRYSWVIVDGPSDGQATIADGFGITGFSTPYEYHYFKLYNENSAYLPVFAAWKEGQYTIRLQAMQISEDALTGESGIMAEEVFAVVDVVGGYTASRDDCGCEVVGSGGDVPQIALIIGLLALFVCWLGFRRRFS